MRLARSECSLPTRRFSPVGSRARPTCSPRTGPFSTDLLCASLSMRSISQWWQGTKAFALLQAREAAGLDVLVSPEKSLRRAQICVACSQNEVPSKLSWLVKWANGQMRQKVDGAKTKVDDMLGVCKACSCELRTIVHFDADVLKAVTPAASLAKLPAHCWKRKELTA